MRSSVVAPIVGLLCAARPGLAISLDPSDANSVKDASKTIVADIMKLYDGAIPGLFPQPPYYWWESGLAWDSLINYWSLTGDDTYIDTLQKSLMWQVGPDDNFMPPNQTNSEGNDDQSTWALAAMTAAERGLPVPSGNTSWSQLAKNVFDSQVQRWDQETCGGGLRWQILSFNSGYTYKNFATLGRFMELASRLALYTGDHSYSDWATKAFHWALDIGMITANGSIYDGTDSLSNCTKLSLLQWSADVGTFLSSAGYMLNFTDDSTWADLGTSVLQKSSSFFAPNDIMVEPSCEPNDSCDTDQRAFRGLYARGLADFRNLAAKSKSMTGNSTSNAWIDQITRIVQTSARGAAAQCTGGKEGTLCGTQWNSTNDGTTGLSEQLSVLEVVLANLPAVPLRNINSTTTKGTSSLPNGSNSTGSNSTGSQSPPNSGAGSLSASMVTLAGSAVFAAVLCL